MKKINGDVNQPTDQPTDRPTNRQGEYRAICLFRKLENRKKRQRFAKTITVVMIITMISIIMMISIVIIMTAAQPSLIIIMVIK